jgi:hypothetical protein
MHTIIVSPKGKKLPLPLSKDEANPDDHLNWTLKAGGIGLHLGVFQQVIDDEEEIDDSDFLVAGTDAKWGTVGPLNSPRRRTLNQLLSMSDMTGERPIG